MALSGWPWGYVRGRLAEEVLKRVDWPDEWPYSDADFHRQDESGDAFFYENARLVTHVDDGFIAALRDHYAEAFAAYPEARILDLCSSWISHYPEDKTWSHVSITGMNEFELSQNKIADDYSVRDLNVTPVLPYDAASFDIVTCAVSMDYLCQPLQVMQEVARVLKPGGMVILSTSNRCFPTKAVSLWLRTEDLEHVLIYGSYIHYTSEFEPPAALDLGGPESKAGAADPVYVIQATKKSSS